VRLKEGLPDFCLDFKGLHFLAFVGVLERGALVGAKMKYWDRLK
jgi:hypothetical protein